MDYSAKDIEVFNNYEFLPWQEQLFNMLFDKDGYVTEPNPGKIISIVDEQSNKGKSVFLKWLFYMKPNDVGQFPYTSSQQLRSVITRSGPKLIYVIDLPRTKGKNDQINNILAVLEEIKNGNVMNAMFEQPRRMLMNPLHVVVFSNTQLLYEALPADRWEAYTITETEEPRLSPISLRVPSNLVKSKYRLKKSFRG
jgi:hypothetical protein